MQTTLSIVSAQWSSGRLPSLLCTCRLPSPARPPARPVVALVEVAETAAVAVEMVEEEVDALVAVAATTALAVEAAGEAALAVSVDAWAARVAPESVTGCNLQMPRPRRHQALCAATKPPAEA